MNPAYLCDKNGSTYQVCPTLVKWDKKFNEIEFFFLNSMKFKYLLFVTVNIKNI